MKKFAALLALSLAIAARAGLPTNAPACLELSDQYDTPQKLAFPATNVIVLTIADQKGSAQIDGWISLLKERYANRIDLRGLADVGGVPAFLRGRIRKQFQATRKHPVMMDWSGKVCAEFGYARHQANLLVLDRSGRIAGRVNGPATGTNLAAFCTLLDAALVANVNTFSNLPTRSTKMDTP